LALAYLHNDLLHNFHFDLFETVFVSLHEVQIQGILMDGGLYEKQQRSERRGVKA
jgi:hypothetical protein